MKKSNNQFAMTSWIAAVGLFICQCQSATAGWTGAMNGVGFGWASVNVTSSTLNSNSVQTPNMTNPSAAMTNTPTYSVGAPLPKGASAATIARIKGAAGYIWTAKTVGSDGDKTDNASIDALINVTPAECASLEMDATATLVTNTQAGIVTVNANATPGTALLLRGFEYTGPNPPQSIQDLETNPNSSLLWHILLMGPLNLNSSNCNPVTIPFSFNTSITNVYFVCDGEAKSLPLDIFCPSNIVVGCGEPVVYQGGSYSACGNVTTTFDPPEGSSFPVGVTPVLVTITDELGNSTNCTFTVTVQDSPPTVPILPVLTGECSVQVPTPTTTRVCGGVTNLVSGTTSNPTTYNTQGNFTVVWTFNDGFGGIVTANQTVIVQDTNPPITPTLPNLTYNYCSSTAASPPTPTTTDICGATVYGKTTTLFPITALGTTVVTWAFTGVNGLSTTATQKVTLSGLTFSGFESPINGVNGSCSSPFCVITCGSVIPIQFDLSCGSTPVTSGTPPVVTVETYNNCVAGATLVTANAAYYRGDWYYDWNTGRCAKGTYKVTVLLPDGTSQYVFIRLK